MSFTGMETRNKKQTQRNLFTTTSGGFVIVVTNVVKRRQRWKYFIHNAWTVKIGERSGPR